VYSLKDGQKTQLYKLYLFNLFYSKNFRIDASSDTLILQNDKSFQYFEYYNQIFPSKKILVLAIQSNKKIEENYIKNINFIQNKLQNIDGIESTFSIVDAPILLLNNLTLADLANKEISTINNSKNDLDLILKEFSSSPIFNNQIINQEQTVSSIIIYLQKDLIFNTIKEKRKNIIKEFGSSSIQYNKINKQYLNLKKNYNKKRNVLISKIRDEIKEYKNGLDDNQELEMDFIKEIKKLGERIQYESVFPPNALDGMEKSIRDFDGVQKKEQGAIRIKDILLFPAGTIVASGPTCAEDGPGRWLPKPSDTFRIFGDLLKPSVGFKMIPMIW